MINDDIRTLLEALNGLAARFLEEGEVFPPSGAILATDGNVSFHKPYDGEGYAEPEQQVVLLETSFRQSVEKGEIRACAYGLDVTAQDPRDGETKDAILVSAENEAGQAIDIFTPYTQEGGLEFGRPFAAERSPRVFAEPAPN